jgi:hypothetical protein
VIADKFEDHHDEEAQILMDLIDGVTAKIETSATRIGELAERTPPDPCDDHRDDEEHRPDNDARQATGGAMALQVGGMAREECRQGLRRLYIVDDACGYG